MIKELIEDFYASKGKDRAKIAFYISDAGKCPRAIWFSLKNYPKKPIESRIRRILEHGDYTHMRIMGALFSLGLIKAVEVEIPENEFIHGRADAIITLDNEPCIIEIKSIHSAKFNKEEPDKDHVLQTQLYMHHFKIKQAIIIYENKNTQELKEYLIKYDKEQVEEVLNTFKKIKIDIEKDTLPLIPQELEKWRCDYCPYIDSCKKLV